MLFSYLRIALRNLMGNRVYSLINIIGLTIGLAAFILILTYIKNEFSYDRFHEKADRIYRVVEIQHPPGLADQHVAVTMGPLAAALKADIPEVAESARIMPIGQMYCRNDDIAFYEDDAVIADPAVFDIFSIPLLEGDAATALSAPNNVVINAEMAAKYFPDESAVGKSLTMSSWVGTMEMRVSAVMADYPRNSHINFRYMIPYETVAKERTWMNNWHSNSMATYILLPSADQAPRVEDQLPGLIERHIEDHSWNEGLTMYLQPILDIHLHSDHIKYQTFNYQQGSIQYIYTFSLIGLFILLIACINFMNLSTARSLKRAREVGIRKALGSRRSLLILQFLGESVFLAVLALVLAIGLVLLISPGLQELTGHRFFQAFYEMDNMVWEMLGIALLTGLISGSYPAFFLSAYQPVLTLRGNLGSRNHSGAMRLRRILVVIQFAIAMVLIVNTGIVSDQMRYVQNKHLGFDREQVVYLPLRGEVERRKVPLLKNALLAQSGIRHASASAGLRGASGSQSTFTAINGEEQVDLMMRQSYVDVDYIETMGMEMAAGRGFSSAFAGDTSNAVIINQAAAATLGWDDPLGKEFESDDQRLTVIGVVKDFHFYKLTLVIEPLIMRIQPDRFNYLLVKIAPENIPQSLSAIETAWRTHLPERPYESNFLDTHVSRLYDTEQNTGRLFGAFSFLAIFIACLGLFGLAAFTAEQKTREIGVRKVLGATIPSIVALLSGDFLRWVLVASIVAAPLAYVSGREWLAGFAYHTDIDPLVFLGAAVLVALIALITVAIQAIRAALANPVDALRYE